MNTFDGASLITLVAGLLSLGLLALNVWQLGRDTRASLLAPLLGVASPLLTTLLYLWITGAPFNLLSGAVLFALGALVGLWQGQATRLYMRGPIVFVHRGVAYLILWGLALLLTILLGQTGSAALHAGGILATLFGVGAALGVNLVLAFKQITYRPPPPTAAAPVPLPGQPVGGPYPPVYIMPIAVPAVMPAPAATTRGGCGCLQGCLLGLVLLALVAGGGYYAYTSGMVTQETFLNLVGMGPATVRISNLRDDALHVSITPLNAPKDSTPTTGALDLGRFDVDTYKAASAGRYRVDFALAKGGAALGTCTLTVRSGDEYQFVALPAQIAINRAPNPPTAGADLVVASSALCR